MILQEKINKLYEQNIFDFYVMNDYGWDTIDSLTEKDLQEDESNFSLIQASLLLNDAHGIYIPELFIKNFDMNQWHINKNNYIDLNSPHSESYWESWEEILNNAYCILNGKKWHLYQDGDLWAVHYL